MRLLILASIWCVGLYGAECSHLWLKFLSTDPLVAKPLSGDTHAAYAVLSFWGDPDVALELKGQYPRARFTSLESQNTKLSINHSKLLDYEVEPDAGSLNPYREGVDINTQPRDFTVIAEQKAGQNRQRNILELPKGYLSQSIVYRIYSPTLGAKVTEKDLPRVYARNRKTGLETSCPKAAAYHSYFPFPQWWADVYVKFFPMEFQSPGEAKFAGLNKAAGYSYAVSRVNFGDVVRVRFAAPTFFNSQFGKGKFFEGNNVRYWSFCINNFPKNETLACLADYAARVDSKGYVNLVIGGDNEVRDEANRIGASYLPDTRKKSQNVMGFVLRNLVPEKGFKQWMYQGPYLPTAKICTKQEFMTGLCTD